MASGSNMYLEYIQCTPNSELMVNSLQYHYESFNAPVCLHRSQNGFFQEVRYDILLCEGPITSMKAPFYYYNTMAYSPYYMANFELGEFIYPIIMRPFLFNSKYYNHYTQLYYFYLMLSMNQPPYYYINIPFHHIDKTEGKDYYMVFIYRHPVVLNTCPLDYQWCLYKVLLPISSPQCIMQIQAHEKFKGLIKKIFANDYPVQTNFLSTRELIPEALWNHFEVNYTYRFGYNYGLNGVFPSNNGLQDCQTSSVRCLDRDSMCQELN